MLGLLQILPIAAPDTPAPDSTATEKASTNRNVATEKTGPSAKFRPVRKALDPPEAEEYTIRLLEGLTGEELEIVKITAQFVARNGKSFLTALTSRENSNPQFQFLKPTHSMFRFFTSVADTYSKVLMPAEGLKDKLKKSVTNMTTVLERCLHRLEWEQSQEQARQKAEDEIQQEKLQMSMIDWHDFIVVENIDFADYEDDYMPPPMSLDEVIRRSKMTSMEVDEVVDPGKEVEMEMDEEEVQLVQEGMVAESREENNQRQMRIVKNWKRPEERVSAERNPAKYVFSPITGEVIPVNEMSEHMRISLIDPKFKEQKDRMLSKLKESTLARDDEISRNIVGLSRTRPDIFGTTEEEVSNAIIKAEVERKNDEQPKLGQTAPTAQYSTVNNGSAVVPQSMTWIKTMLPPLQHLPPPMQMNYGQQPSPKPMGQAMSGNPPVPPPPSLGHRPYMPQYSMPMVAPLPMPQRPPLPDVAPPPLPEEPEPKKRRLDDSLLLPEYQFLAQHPVQGAFCVTVLLQVDDEKLKTKSPLEITVESLSETVGSLKAKIEREIQCPANKQKLSGKAGFLKDNLSLAYYNVGAGDTLTLSLRERGGRKK